MGNYLFSQRIIEFKYRTASAPPHLSNIGKSISIPIAINSVLLQWMRDLFEMFSPFLRRSAIRHYCLFIPLFERRYFFFNHIFLYSFNCFFYGFFFCTKSVHCHLHWMKLVPFVASLMLLFARNVIKDIFQFFFRDRFFFICFTILHVICKNYQAQKVHPIIRNDHPISPRSRDFRPLFTYDLLIFNLIRVFFAIFRFLIDTILCVSHR